MASEQARGSPDELNLYLLAGTTRSLSHFVSIERGLSFLWAPSGYSCVERPCRKWPRCGLFISLINRFSNKPHPKQNPPEFIGDPNARDLQGVLGTSKLCCKSFCMGARRCIIGEQHSRTVKNFGAVNKVKVIPTHAGLTP